MKLQDLLQGLNYQCLSGTLEQTVDEVIYDSRIKTKQGLFIAIEGFKVDGHQFIEKALQNGAKTIVVQKAPENFYEGVTVIKVQDTRAAMAIIACNRYHNPSEKFELIGVTGTNGKTSITFLLGQVLEAYEKKIGVIGTIENRIGDRILKAERTTPEAIDLQSLFSKMVENHIDYALMEVSSHALALHRVDGSKFRMGIFTNLTQDHLDFHKTMQEYANAKEKLFVMCKEAIINLDSEYGEQMCKAATGKCITYAIDKKADYMAKNIHMEAAGVSFTLQIVDKEYKVQVPIPGRFTVYNTLAVIAAATTLGIPIDFICTSLKSVRGVPGRVQSFSSTKGYTVLVDYAHTPDGLENVLSSIKQFATGKIFTVFGCGGDRDKTKRPLMGSIAATYSDEVIITSDNPRTEDPIQILKDIEVGVKEKTNQYHVIEDRRAAIEYALKLAAKGDIILVAGKGHENYQILKDRIIHFDDCEIVTSYIQEEQ